MTIVAMLLFPAAMAFAASSDLLTMRISNKLVLFLVASFCVLALAINLPLQQFAMHVVCALAVLAVGFTLFALRWIGGGDAKLAAATALWFGFAHLLDYLLYASSFGGVLTLALLQFRKLPLPGILTRQAWIMRLHDSAGDVPYGIALAAAALAVYPKTGWMPGYGL